MIPSILRHAPTVRHLTTAALMAAIALGNAPGLDSQGRTTRQGDPPAITAGGQTNWTSHNLDLNNSRYSELDQIDTTSVGRLAEQWSFAVPARGRT